MISSFAAYIVMHFISKEYGRMLFPYEETPYLILFAVYLFLFALSMLAFFLVSKEKYQIYSRLAEEIAELSCPVGHAFSERKRSEILSEFGKKIRRLHVMEGIYAVVSVLLTGCMPFAGDYDILGLFWFFRLSFGVVLIVHSLLLTDAFQKEIEKTVE